MCLSALLSFSEASSEILRKGSVCLTCRLKESFPTEEDEPPFLILFHCSANITFYISSLNYLEIKAYPASFENLQANPFALVVDSDPDPPILVDQISKDSNQSLPWHPYYQTL